MPRPGVLFALVLIFVFAASYLAFRILEGTSGAQGQSGRGLLLAALIAAGAALWRTKLPLSERERRTWWLIAGGCVVWALAHPFRDGLDDRSLILFNAGYLIMLVTLIGGGVALGEFTRGIGSWRHVALDLLPPVVALFVTIWLVMIGPSVHADGSIGRLSLIAMLHGLGTVTAMVVGIAGFVSHRRVGAKPAALSLLTGVGIIAVGDLLWLQQWLDRPASLSTAADAVFCIGFVTVAVAGLQARTARGGGAIRRSEVPPRLALQPAGPSLLLLLALAWGQVMWEPLTERGIEITIAAGLWVVLFSLMREGITARRERLLTEEVGELSERIDLLISQVGRDPLTGLLNHRAVHERLEHELAMARVQSTLLAVVLVDVDNFKAVNDTLGHQVGDQVLQAVASVLTAACRATDVAARYAGDEFMLLLPGLGEAAAGTVCTRVLEAVRQINEQLDLGEVRVTLSVGVAVTHKARRSVAQLVAIADAAMYDAKMAGKDGLMIVNADSLVTTAYWGLEPDPVGPIHASSYAGEDRRGSALEQAS